MEINETQYQYDFKENFVPDNENSLDVEIKKMLMSIIKNEGYVKYKVDKRIFKDNGNGFLGVLCEADIKGEAYNGYKETNIFAKFKTPGEQITIISLSDAYLRELFVYKELSNVYEDLQNEFNVPLDVRYKFAKYYNESNKDVIVLENLCRNGYSTLNRMDVITLDFAKIAIKELAKFHALSFVVQKKRPIYFQRKLYGVKYAITFNEDWTRLIKNLFSATMSYLDEGIKKRFEQFMSRHLEMYKKYIEDGNCVRCICHGDYRPGNVMKKEIDGIITQIIPIDYQTVHYGNPINDFLYFIFGATDQKFRRSNLVYLKDLYYQELSNFLLYFDVDVEAVYPRIDFEKVYKERLDFGLMSSVILIPFILSADEAVPDLTSGKELHFNNGITDVCKKRMVGLIEDFIEWGYL